MIGSELPAFTQVGPLADQQTAHRRSSPAVQGPTIQGSKEKKVGEGSLRKEHLEGQTTTLMEKS